MITARARGRTRPISSTVMMVSNILLATRRSGPFGYASNGDVDLLHDDAAEALHVLGDVFLQLIEGGGRLALVGHRQHDLHGVVVRLAAGDDLFPPPAGIEPLH